MTYHSTVLAAQAVVECNIFKTVKGLAAGTNKFHSVGGAAADVRESRLKPLSTQKNYQ
jgi:hypothetical protein